MRPFLVDLRIAGLLTEMELGPLTAQETSALATAIGAQTLQPATLDQIYQASEGSPLFVVEIVQDLVRELATDAHSHPSAAPAPAFQPKTLPVKLHAVIQARLNQLSPPARELAAVAATCGRAFTFDLLAYASDLDEATLVRALDELWQRRLVREQGLQAYDFSHDAIREVACTGSGPAGQRRLHGRVAAALQQVHAHDLDAISAELAAHYQQAGAMRQAIEWHRRAAEVATRRFDFARSTNYLNTALALLDTLAPSPPRNDLEFTLLFAQISNLVVVEGFTGPKMTRTFQTRLCNCRPASR